MIIINYLNYRNQKMILKNIPSRTAIPFYLLDSKRANVKIVVTKRTF